MFRRIVKNGTRAFSCDSKRYAIEIRGSLYLKENDDIVGCFACDDFYDREKFSEKDVETALMAGMYPSDIDGCFVSGNGEPIKFTFKKGSKHYLCSYDGNDIECSEHDSLEEALDDYVSRVESEQSFKKKVKCSRGTKTETYTLVYAGRKDRASSRDNTKNMQRVRSSNIWAYSMSIPEDSDVGTLYVQFKNSHGGPGDVYEYYEVPIKLWSKFVSTASKGHFFWRNIRNNYMYRKLTGDKRGKLANAVS